MRLWPLAPCCALCCCTEGCRLSQLQAIAGCCRTVRACPAPCSIVQPAPWSAGESLGVGHYGLSSPSLEEVFLRVTTDAPSTDAPSADAPSTAASDGQALSSSSIPDTARGCSTAPTAAAVSPTRGRSDADSSGSERGGGAEAGEPPGALRRLASAAASASASELHGDHSGDFHAVDIGGGGDGKDGRSQPRPPVPALAARLSGCSASSVEGAPTSEAPVAPGGIRRCVRLVLYARFHTVVCMHGVLVMQPAQLQIWTGLSFQLRVLRMRIQLPHASGNAPLEMSSPWCPPSSCRCGGSHRHARHLREMVRKRALAAGRDVRGAVFTLLLPVLAVAAVLVRCSSRPPPLIAVLMQRHARRRGSPEIYSVLVCQSIVTVHVGQFAAGNSRPLLDINMINRDCIGRDRHMIVRGVLKLGHCAQSILKVNIDPTAPRLELTLDTFGESLLGGRVSAAFTPGSPVQFLQPAAF